MDYYIIQLFLLTVPILYSLTLHELAHGYSAYFLGDPTPKVAGRLSLNPFKHIDIIGLAMLFITRSFGWAKPVPVSPANLNRPRSQMMIISLAGPATNVLIALISAMIYHLSVDILKASPLLFPMAASLQLLVKINLSLALFNLIPIPPLDGSHIMKGLIPYKHLKLYLKIEPYGFIVLVVFIFSGILSTTFVPVINTLTRFLL
jgi:Zn-dependent protease